MVIKLNNNILKNSLRVNNNLILPSYIIKYYKKLDLKDMELILLLYLINQKDDILFDISKISKDLYTDNNTILELINNLNEKNYISIDMKKNNGVIEEHISTDLFFNKINSLLLEEPKNEVDSTIYDDFESEFGRALSPTEYETISSWIERGIDEDLIKEALKEAILSGARNIKYIDSILLNWTKNGYKKKEDINKNKKDNDNDEEIIYDYDWVNE